MPQETMASEVAFGAFGNADTPPLSFMNGDDRGGPATNNKPSLTITDAGVQLTRTGLTWATGLGQAANVTYAFRSTAPTTMPSDTAGFTRFTEIQISATLLALQAWADVANITFTRVQDPDGFSNTAVMVFGNYGSGSAGSAAFAYNPGSRSTTSAAGDVWIGTGVSSNTFPTLLNYGQHTLVHEIGHAIGLSHPAAYNAAEGVSITYGADATYYEDSRQYTVMSYFSQINTGGSFGNNYSSAPLLDDIAAAQRLYGANITTRTGDTVYGFNSNAGQAWYAATSASSALIFAVWDAGGTDTLDFSGYAQAQTIDLRQGAFSSVGGLTGNVSIALGAVIERAIGGSGADFIYGSAGDNVITGGAGNDTIYAGLGSDTAAFSGARSAYTITFSGQRTIVTGPDGTDTLWDVEFLRFSDQTVTVPAYAGPLLVAGDITNNTINGSAQPDTIEGRGGDDVINGLGSADNLDGGWGDDSLFGGDGDDTLIGGLGNDQLDGGAGTDTASFQGTAGGVIVNLTTGVAAGGAGNDTLVGIENVIGTAFSDVITGDAGANYLQGNGGIDVIYGRGGNDQLYAGAPGATGGAPDIAKTATTANASIATAVSIDGGFDLLARGDVGNSTTIPHATIVATSHGGIEYYAFTVTAGATVVFDVDDASFDSTLRILNADGSQLAENDDGGADSAETDSQLTYTFTVAGTYYVQVARWSINTGSTFTTQAPTSGSTYTLHISIPNHGVMPLTASGSTLYGEDGDDSLYGGSGSDALYGGDGNDTLSGGPGGNDILDGGNGNDIISLSFGGATASGGSGDDTFRLGFGDNIVDGGDGIDTLVTDSNSTSFTISTVNGVTTLTSPVSVQKLTNVERIQFGDRTIILGATGGATDGPDNLVGTAGPDTIDGLGGDDVITAGAGSDTIDGGAGIDTLALTGAATGYYFERTSNGWRVYDGVSDVDTVTNVEQVRFGSGATLAFAAAASSGFDAYRYMAGYADLIQGYGSAPWNAYRHYLSNGQAEGRSPTAFDPLRYVASNRDLVSYLGVDAQAASQHYVQNGFYEGRALLTFDALEYTASNPDLARYFGVNVDGATRHYIQNGFYEGRALATFDPLIYEASNPDLARYLGINPTQALNHYLTYGANEGRVVNSFDPLTYIASNVDLARWLGTDTVTALRHYITNGVYENRQTASFDARLYAASSIDLARYLGGDTRLATEHYILHGNYEGRPTAGFDAVGYLLSNGDLGGMTASQALDHWLSNGADEGRAGDAIYGREQASHLLTGGVTTAAIEGASDRDWFRLDVTAGQRVTIDVGGAGAGVGTLTDTFLVLYDSLGRYVALDNDSGSGADSRLTFTAPGSGFYYIAVSGNGPVTGTYRVTVTTASGQGVLDDKDPGPQTSPFIDTELMNDQFIVQDHGSPAGQSAAGAHLIDDTWMLQPWIQTTGVASDSIFTSAAIDPMASLILHAGTHFDRDIGGPAVRMDHSDYLLI